MKKLDNWAGEAYWYTKEEAEQLFTFLKLNTDLILQIITDEYNRVFSRFFLADSRGVALTSAPFSVITGNIIDVVNVKPKPIQTGSESNTPLETDKHKVEELIDTSIQQLGDAESIPKKRKTSKPKSSISVDKESNSNAEQE